MGNPDTAACTVYLAGPVAHVPDGGSGWRQRIERQYGDDIAFRNPLGKYNVPADDLTIVPGTSDPADETTVGVDEIVAGDKTLLRESDAVLVGYAPTRSIGTPMEVMWAFERDYPIALWPRRGTREADLSPWYRHHVDYIGHVSACLSWLVGATDQAAGGETDG